MIVFGPRIVDQSLAGDEVATHRVSFSSQEEQIRFLRQMVDQYRAVYAIRARARDIVFRQRVCRAKDKRAQALAIASWVQDNITYVEELPELFQAPPATVAQGYGDCDDFTTLIGSLLEGIGIESELVALAWDGAYRHIFPRAVFTEGGRTVRLPLDATMGRSVYDLTDPIRIARQRHDDVAIYVG